MAPVNADLVCVPTEGPRRLSILHSTAVGLLGMIVATALVWLVLKALHPGVWAMAFGIPSLCALIPGWTIGLLDRARPAATALAASALFSIGLLVILGAFGRYGESGLWLFVPLACLFAGCGARAGQLVKGARRNVVIGSSVLAVAFVAAFIVPEALHRREADRFLAARFDDVRAFVGEDMVQVPSTGVTWRDELTGGLWPGIQLEAGWRLTARTAGGGRCDLTIRIAPLPRQGEIHDYVEWEDFSFQPDGQVRLRTGDQARALLRELGVREPPEGLEGSTGLQWFGHWRRKRRGRAHAYYDVVVRHTGQVTARRSSPMVD